MTTLPAALRDAEGLFAAIEGVPLPRSVGALFESVRSNRPNQVAIRLVEGGEYTYAQLEDAVAAAAGALKAHGVTSSCRIAILLPNIIEFPIVYLAASRLGACVVPINTAYTAAEIGYVLADAGVRFAIVEEKLRPAFEHAAATTTLPAGNVFIVNGADDDRSWSQVCRDARPQHGDEGTGAALLTIQYTSGTTGFPKGALLSQRYWLTLGLAQSVELKHLDVRNILVVHSFFYMDPFWQLILAFVLKGTIVLAPRMSASKFMAWVREFHIHYALVGWPVFKQPPSPLDQQHHLRLLQTYGFSKQIHADFEARFKVAVREIYGMTEIGAGTFLPLHAHHMVGSGSVGIAAPFRRLKIVDSSGAEAPAGDVGELWVHGEGLFDGYHNLPEVTKEVLHDGWMSTGDLFRRDPNGYFYLVGRLKDMVRRNMENVSCHEVEQVLISHPGVSQAAVLSVPDAKKGEEVLALLVLREGESPEHVTPQVLKDHCAARLAKFKLPRYVGYRPALPVTPSGKVAKGELRRAADLVGGTFDLEAACWVPAADLPVQGK